MFEPSDTARGRRSLGELASRAGLKGAPRVAVAGVVVLTVAALGMTMWKLGRPEAGAEFAFTAGSVPSSAPDSPGATAPESAAEAPTLWVHVAGAVNAPGLFELAAGSRVGEALAAAGGLRADALSDAVNLARPLRDGEQVYVPATAESVGGAGAGAVAGGSGAQQGGAISLEQGIDINRASVAELDALPGVGPATAERIVADREANGPFMAPEDLMRVPGIGEKKFEAMAEMVVVR